ncbi:hypothetical protein CR513_39456, partial [Mucuna pruriens]
MPKYREQTIYTFLNAPCDNHWDVMVCILSYTKSAVGKGYFMRIKAMLKWKTCLMEKKEANIAARSSAEAEYQAVAYIEASAFIYQDGKIIALRSPLVKTSTTWSLVGSNQSGQQGRMILTSQMHHDPFFSHYKVKNRCIISKLLGWLSSSLSLPTPTFTLIYDNILAQHYLFTNRSILDSGAERPTPELG